MESNSRAQGNGSPKKEKRIAKGIRCRESVWMGLDAVRQQDGDADLNETACKAFVAYIRDRLAV